MKKNKTGFTLVELIVVIAIIAILAVIIVPTSLHYVKKANINKEIQQMNISDQVQILFVSAKNESIDLTNTSTNEEYWFSNRLKEIDLPYQYLGKIEIEISGMTDKWIVKLTLKGQQYGDIEKGSIISATLLPVFTDEQLFKQSLSKPNKPTKYTYGIDINDGSISLIG